MPILVDLSHTSHTRARTGIQRVSRSILRALGGSAQAVTFDPHEGAWRPLDPWERLNLEPAGQAAGRGARWPLAARVRGRLRRLAPRDRLGAGHEALIVPEVFSADVGAALAGLRGAVRGPRVALFHDAIALQLPELSPRSTVARFPSYLQALLRFDGVAAVSEASRASLEEYWSWLGVANHPPVAAIPLGIDAPPGPAATPAPGPEPVVLSVGSLEGRKNHLALLGACEALWGKGMRFRLRLAGMANLETGAAALRAVRRMRAAGRPIDYAGQVSETELEEAYAGCAFTVYPSLAEGFGMPVAESLVRGRPCLCRMEGALGEVAQGGGCLDLGSAQAAEIAGAISSLLENPYELARLAAAAKARRFSGWDRYAAEIRAWMGDLGRRAA